MVDLLAPGGRIVFYGATSGYTLAFLGKPGSARARELLRRADLRPSEAVLVYYGHGAELEDAVGAEAIGAAIEAGARVVAATRSDAQAAHVQATLGVHGVVSLETLGKTPGFRWPDTMPDYDVDPEGYRAYQDHTLKPFGQAIGRLLATSDNPRGNPDLVVERAGQDTLGVSTFVCRPFTGRVVYLEDTGGQRLSFYAPNVWMNQKRIVFPTFAVLGSHLSNAHQAAEVIRLLDGGALAVHAPSVCAWDELAEANQAIHENRHTGTITVRVGAPPAGDGARTARQVYEAWGSRFLDSPTVRVRLDPVDSGLVALITIDVPPANTIGRATLDDLERTLDALEAERSLRACVLTGAGTMFVAGADVRQLRAFARAEDVERFARRAQRVFARIAGAPAPVIAAVDGYALGGGNELQMACGYRVASRRAEVGQPEINLHVIPGFGGTQMLPRLAVRRALAGRGELYALLVGALAALLDGRRRSAADALALGLVDEIAPMPCRTRSASRAASRTGRSKVSSGRRSCCPRRPSRFPTSSATARSSVCWPTTSASRVPPVPAPSSRSCARGSPTAWRRGSCSKPASSAGWSLPTTAARASIASSRASRCRCPRGAPGKRRRPAPRRRGMYPKVDTSEGSVTP